MKKLILLFFILLSTLISAQNLDSIQRLQLISSIKITNPKITKTFPNDRIDMQIQFGNRSTKTINKIICIVRAYDFRDNLLSSNLNGLINYSAILYGPFYPKDKVSLDYIRVFYNSRIDYLKIVEIDIFFSDGSELKIVDEKEIKITGAFVTKVYDTLY